MRSLNSLAAVGPVIALAALALAGCTPTGSGDGVVESSTPTPDALSLEPPKCLIGEWYISQAELQVFYDSVTAATDGAVSFVVDGDTGLSFDGTAFEYTPDLTLAVATPAAEGVGTLNGSISGGYTATATTIATTNEAVDVDYGYTVDGVTADASALFGTALTGSPINGGDYECTANGPLISFDNGFGRVPVQLVPAG